jgi:hypothetical protein
VVKNLEQRDPTGGASYDPAASERAFLSGNIGGASGAYNMANDSGKAQYDYMHELGTPSFIQSPREALNAMGEKVGVSHAGDATMSDPFKITNPLDMLRNPGGTLLGDVMDPDKGLGFTGMEMPGGAAGGKPITNMNPTTRAIAKGMQDGTLSPTNGDMHVDNIMGLNTGSGSGGGGGGGGGGSGTTLDQGRGISLPDQLVYANGDVGRTKSLSDSIRGGEFAPPSDARQLQLDSVQNANGLANAAQGPGMGSFLTPPPGPSQGSTQLKQPGANPFASAANMSLQTSGPMGPAAAAAAGGLAPPPQGPGGATPATMGLKTGSPLLGQAPGTPMQASPANSSMNLAQSTRAPISNQLPPGTPLPVTSPSNPGTNPVFSPSNWAPPAPPPAAAPPGGPQLASLGARQDVGSYLTGSRATDPWSSQVQGFLQAPEGPSAAQAQLTQARDQSMADALSLAHSGRGGAGQQARALRGAMSQNAATQSQAGQAAALLRANESQNFKNQQLQGLGLGSNIAAGKDQNTLSALGLSGNLATGIDQNRLSAETLAANTAQGMRGLDISESGQKQQGVLDAERIAAGRTGDILNASTSAYATDRGIDSKENLGPGDIKYWTDKI